MPPSLWIRRLDLTTPQQLRGTQDAASPFWSPDSRFIGFFAEGKLKRINASGGSAQVLCDTESGSGTWSRSGIILFSQRPGLYQVSEDGGTPVLVTELDTSRHETAHLWPHFLPDGQHYFYLTLNSDRGNDAIYVSSLKAKNHTRLVSADSMGIYVSGPNRRGYVLFVRNGSLMEQAFDADKLKLIGEPALIVDGLIDPDGNPYIQGNFSASDTGVLAYHSGADPDNSTKTELVWFERSGKRLETIELPGLKFVPRISPNGKQLAIERVDAKTGNLNIWVLGLDRGSASPFTLDSTGHNFAPVWSADGTRLVFASSRSGHQGLYQKSASGAEDEQLLLPTAPNFTFPTDWSQDGRFVSYTVQQPGTKYDLWILPLEGDRKPFPFLQTPFSEMYGHFSPDGRWLAYSSDESGRWEVYIRAFHQTGSGGQWQISNQGGTHPFWRRDGKELFYIAADRRLMSVDINTRQKKNQLELEPGLPKALFNTGTTFSTRRPYAGTADGQRFLILTRAVGDKGPEPITVVVNWAPDLKQP
jgi:eukaryotic-like serine/threonine-protein kinase